MLSELARPWWTWNPETAGTWDLVYRGFNLFEAAAWFLFAVLVWGRWGRCRRTSLELLYGGSFLLFGLTDVAESYQQSAPLVALKGIVLLGLLILRSRVRTRWYPASRLY